MSRIVAFFFLVRNGPDNATLVFLLLVIVLDVLAI